MEPYSVAILFVQYAESQQCGNCISLPVHCPVSHQGERPAYKENITVAVLCFTV